jgi:hypothetical protein
MDPAPPRDKRSRHQSASPLAHPPGARAAAGVTLMPGCKTDHMCQSAFR